MQGKYSPTVSSWYRQDQKWFEKNGGGFGNGKNPDSDFDNDGFDSYGYDQYDIDRAGVREDEYYSNDSLFEAIGIQYDSKIPSLVGGVKRQELSIISAAHSTGKSKLTEYEKLLDIITKDGILDRNGDTAKRIASDIINEFKI